MTAPEAPARTAGPGPRVLVESLPDTASVNAADRLREDHDWQDTAHLVDGRAVRVTSEATTPDGHPIFLATIGSWHVSREGLGEEIAAAIGRPIEALLVLSRHRAASGVPSFTAHPVGNAGPEAAAGGAPRTPTPTHPGLLTAALHALDVAIAPVDLPHTVGFEATHHGPHTAVPVVFIEIGSDESHWGDGSAGGVLARAAWSAIQSAPTVPEVSVMGLGGGHYAPRFTDLVRETGASVGHMLASYHWDDGVGPDREVLASFLAASAPPGRERPDAVYFDKKSFKGPVRGALRDALADLDVRVVRTGDLPPPGRSLPQT